MQFGPALFALLKFFHVIFQLKNTARTAWLQKGMENAYPESIADHMYRVAMIAMVAPMDEGMDRQHCVMMALVHDLAEAIVGDITPICGVSQEEKERREREAMAEITKDLAHETASLINGLWEEYEAGETAEAKLVKQIDKFEFALQAVEYEERDGRDFSDFVDAVNPRLKDPLVRSFYDVLMAERSSKKASSTHHNIQ